jgi:hypothetical protein
VIGTDDAGAEIKRRLTADGNNVDARLFAMPRRPTTVKTRFIRGSHQLLRVDEETVSPLDDKGSAEVTRRFERALLECETVVLSDYAKGILCDPVLRTVVGLARAAYRPVIADPKRHFRGLPKRHNFHAKRSGSLPRNGCRCLGRLGDREGGPGSRRCCRLRGYPRHPFRERPDIGAPGNAHLRPAGPGTRSR